MDVYQKIMDGIDDKETQTLSLLEIMNIGIKGYEAEKEYIESSEKGWFMQCHLNAISSYWQPIKTT